MHLRIGNLSINAQVTIPGDFHEIELHDDAEGYGILIPISALEDLAAALQSIHRLVEIGSKK